MIFSYEDGGRTPFNPFAMGAHLAGCILCARRRIASIGIFIPRSPEMEAVVLRLRRHPQRAQSTACIAYALCARCMEHADVTKRVEGVLVATAERITLQ